MFLKWVGGKGHVASRIADELLPESFGTYLEPFLGGGAVFFELRRRGLLEYGAILSDQSPLLIETFQAVSRSPEGLIRKLEALNGLQGAEWFLHFRAELNAGHSIRPPGASPDLPQPALDLLGRAARFILINRRGYNGLWRVNADGGCNVPPGDDPTVDIVRADVIRAAAPHLPVEDVELLCRDFEKTIDEAQEGDLVFADPPYLPLKKGQSFTGYSGAFTVADHIRLAKALRRADSRGVRWIACNAAVPLVYDLYTGFTITPIEVARPVNSNGSKRGKVTEFLIFNYTPKGWKNNDDSEKMLE